MASKDKHCNIQQVKDRVRTGVGHPLILLIRLTSTSPPPASPDLQTAKPSNQPAAQRLDLCAGFGKGGRPPAGRSGGPASQTDAAGLHFCEDSAAEAETHTTGGEAHARTCTRTHVHTHTHTHTAMDTHTLTLLHTNTHIHTSSLV